MGARREDKSVRLVTSDWHMRRATIGTGTSHAVSGWRSYQMLFPPRRHLSTLFKEYNKYLMRQLAALAGV